MIKIILASTFPPDNERSPRFPQRLISSNCLKSLASKSGLVDAVMTLAVNMRSKAHAKSKKKIYNFDMDLIFFPNYYNFLTICIIN